MTWRCEVPPKFRATASRISERSSPKSLLWTTLAPLYNSFRDYAARFSDAVNRTPPTLTVSYLRFATRHLPATNVNQVIPIYIYNYNLLVTLELYKYAAPKTSKVKVFSLSRTRAKRRFLYIHRRAQQARGGRRFSRLLVSSHIHLHTPPYSTNLLLYIHIILFLSRALGTSPAYQRHCQYLPANTKKKKKYLSSTHTHFRRKKT